MSDGSGKWPTVMSSYCHTFTLLKIDILAGDGHSAFT